MRSICARYFTFPLDSLRGRSTRNGNESLSVNRIRKLNECQLSLPAVLCSSNKRARDGHLVDKPCAMRKILSSISTACSCIHYTLWCSIQRNQEFFIVLAHYDSTRQRLPTEFRNWWNLILKAFDIWQNENDSLTEPRLSITLLYWLFLVRVDYLLCASRRSIFIVRLSASRVANWRDSQLRNTILMRKENWRESWGNAQALLPPRFE